MERIFRTRLIAGGEPLQKRKAMGRDGVAMAFFKIVLVIAGNGLAKLNPGLIKTVEPEHPAHDRRHMLIIGKQTPEAEGRCLLPGEHR